MKSGRAKKRKPPFQQQHPHRDFHLFYSNRSGSRSFDHIFPLQTPLQPGAGGGAGGESEPHRAGGPVGGVVSAHRDEAVRFAVLRSGEERESVYAVDL